MRKPQPNLESVQAILINNRFAIADLKLSTLVLALRDKKKDHFMALTKSAGLILELVHKSLHPLVNNKFAAKIWTILEDRFQYHSSISITHIFLNVSNVRLSDCKDVVDYINRYHIAFDKILSLINDNKDF